MPCEECSGGVDIVRPKGLGQGQPEFRCERELQSLALRATDVGRVRDPHWAGHGRETGQERPPLVRDGLSGSVCAFGRGRDLGAAPPHAQAVIRVELARAASAVPAFAGPKFELPCWGALGVETNDANTPVPELSYKEVGANVLLVGHHQDSRPAQKPFWSSPVSRSAFFEFGGRSLAIAATPSGSRR